MTRGVGGGGSFTIGVLCSYVLRTSVRDIIRADAPWEASKRASRTPFLEPLTCPHALLGRVQVQKA